MTDKQVSKISEIVHTAIGEASMCWMPTPSTNVFDSNKALDIGLRLITAIQEFGAEKLREGEILGFEAGRKPHPDTHRHGKDCHSEIMTQQWINLAAKYPTLNDYLNRGKE